MGHIGAQLTSITPGNCEIALDFKPYLTQQHGLFHGGVTATLADTASGFAAYSLMADDEQPLTVEFKINLLSKGQGDRLVARAKVVKNGRRIKVCQSEVFVLENDKETLCAIALVSIIATPKTEK